MKINHSIVVMVALGGAVYFLQKRGYKFGFQKESNNQWIEEGSSSFKDLLDDLGQGEFSEYFAGATKAISEGLKLPEVSPVILTLKDTLSGFGDSVADVVPVTFSSAVSSVFNDSKAQLLKQISAGEGTSESDAKRKGYTSGFDVTLGYGAYANDKKKPITEMTFSELKAFQTAMLKHPRNNLNSSACGKYQNTRTNLFGNSGNGWRGMMKTCGFSYSDKFTKSVQTKIAEKLLVQRGYDKYKNGLMSAKDFQKGLSLEWASIQNPYTTRSSYNQHVGTTTAQILPLIESIA